MPERLSRRKLAGYAAEKLIAGDAGVIREIAAYLVAQKKQRELELIVRDIEDALAERGVVVATVTSAHGLTEQMRHAVEAIAGGKTTVIKEVINPDVIGGMQIDLPGKRYDGTVKYKISELKAQKV